MKKDEYYMKIAITLAKKGTGKTSPNPLVGAVLVRGGRVLARGYHKRAGSLHAETSALRAAGTKAKGATLYVNLEPCDHYGKTPPCTESIIKSGIKRVVIGTPDPNPINNGKGALRLKRSGIRVDSGVLEAESKAVNRVFNTFIIKKRPFVTVKAAQSLDGKIATFPGHSRWITNHLSRRFAHRIRSHVDAVLVGINTVLKDDPLLNCRLKSPGKQPLRIGLDSRLRIPKKCRLIRERSSKVIIATLKSSSKKKALELERLGVSVISFKERGGMIDIRELLRFLAKQDVSHLLVEGGGTVIASFFEKGVVDEALFFLSPRIIGGKHALTAVEGGGVRSVNEAIKLKEIKIRRFGGDVLIRGHVYGNN